MHGLRPERSSPKTSLRNPLPASRRGRSRKRGICVESATTELARLPGLGAAEVAVQLKPAHWLERGPSKRLMVFAGSSHPDLAAKIAERLGVELGEIELE